MQRTDSKPDFTKQAVIKCAHCLPWRAWVGFCDRESGQARWVLAGAKNRVVIEEVTGKLKPEGLERTSFQTGGNTVVSQAHGLPQRDNGCPWGWAALQIGDFSLSYYCQSGGGGVTHLSAFSPTHSQIWNIAWQLSCSRVVRSPPNVRENRPSGREHINSSSKLLEWDYYMKNLPIPVKNS